MNWKLLGRLLLDWAIVAIGVLGSILCLCTNPEFGLPTPQLLWFLVPLLSMSFCLLFSRRRGGIYALVLLGMLALMGLLLRRELAESFRCLWGVLGRFYANGYDQVLNLLPRDPVSPAGTEPALLTLALLQCYLCALAVSRWQRSFPAALALLVGIVPCYVLRDTPPLLLPLLAAVFSLLVQIFSQSVRRRASGEEPKAMLQAALLGAGLLGALLLLFPQEGYKPPISWEDLARRMEHWTQERNNQGNITAGLSGNPEQVDLASLGALPSHQSPALYVRSSGGGTLYLRGSGYTDFDGTHWLRGPIQSWPTQVVFPRLGMNDAEDLTLSIETVNREALLYTTYELVSLPTGGILEGDAYVRNAEGRLRYSLRYVPENDPQGTDPDYQQWVRENCLALPERTREGVLAWWEVQRQVYFSDPEAKVADPEALEAWQISATAWQVAQAVSNCAVYSRNPAPMPEGADFCSWFLNEAEEGYCVHYATACAALLRALGIPARYVSGYVCSVLPNHTITVTNLHAHAWVEFYTGRQWLRLEPTPQDATEFTGSIDSPGSSPVDPAETLPAVTMAETEPPESSQEPGESESLVPSEPPASTEAPATEPQAPGPGETQEAEAPNLLWLWILLGVLTPPALLALRRTLALNRWERQLQKAPANLRARLIYRRILALHRHGKYGRFPIPPEAKPLAQKASFSQHSLEPEELDFLRQCLDQQRQHLREKSLWRRFYCKYILALC